MRDEPLAPEAQAALVRCLRASIALAVAADAQDGFLPSACGETDEEAAWRQAIQQRADVQGTSHQVAEDATVMDYQAFYHLTETIQSALHRNCPTHPPIPDFCHGLLQGVYVTLRESMGLTPQTLLDLLNERHKLTSPECRGFTATETALQGCRADRLPSGEPIQF